MPLSQWNWVLKMTHSYFFLFCLIVVYCHLLLQSQPDAAHTLISTHVRPKILVLHSIVNIALSKVA